MSLVIANTEEELTAALFASTEPLVFVDRVMLVSILGTELANRFLPALPQYVSISTEQFETTIRAYKPELIPITSS